MSAFVEFPKLARLSRECTITEKIDGTNSSVFIWDSLHPTPHAEGELHTSVGEPPADIPWVWQEEGVYVAVGSRTRWITPTDDNAGFAKWVLANVEQLVYLGHGRHFGEWWGSGIQRGYLLPKGEKRFSLFNTARWVKPRTDGPTPALEGQQPCPECCFVVPILYQGLFTTQACEDAITMLRQQGSFASPGFARPEGIVCWHHAANMGFKKTLEKDEVPKSRQ